MEYFPWNTLKDPSDSFENKERQNLGSVEIETTARDNLLEMGFSEIHIERIKDLMHDLDYDDCVGKVKRFVKGGIVFDPEKRSVVIRKFHDISENKGQCAILSLLLLDKLGADPQIRDHISEFNKNGTSAEYKNLKNKFLSIDDEYMALLDNQSVSENSNELNRLLDEEERLQSLIDTFDRKKISISKCYGLAPTHFVETEHGTANHIWLEIEYFEYEGSKEESKSIRIVLDPSFRKIDVPDKYHKKNSSHNPVNIHFQEGKVFKTTLNRESTTIGISSDNKIVYNLRFGFDKDNNPFPIIDAIDSTGNIFSFTEKSKDGLTIKISEITGSHVQEIQEILAELNPKYFSRGNLDENFKGGDLAFSGFPQ
ncbi:MAG TPA: hypothetical protein VG621_01295 [Candidatus Paceibacterota bacterium]|nr:hypothetical protein [Candidatus Paceibacterota bacterium]